MATSHITKPRRAATSRAIPRPSFTCKIGKDFHWWGGVKPTGNYTADYETGMALATEWLATTNTAGGVQSLVWIVLDMPRHLDRSGLECGFLAHVARAAALGNLMLDRERGEAFLAAHRATEQKAA